LITFWNLCFNHLSRSFQYNFKEIPEMLRDLQRRNSKMKNPKVGMLVNPHQRSRNPSLKDINELALGNQINILSSLGIH